MRGGRRPTEGRTGWQAVGSWAQPGSWPPRLTVSTGPVAGQQRPSRGRGLQVPHGAGEGAWPGPVVHSTNPIGARDHSCVWAEHEQVKSRRLPADGSEHPTLRAELDLVGPQAPGEVRPGLGSRGLQKGQAQSPSLPLPGSEHSPCSDDGHPGWEQRAGTQVSQAGPLKAPLPYDIRQAQSHGPWCQQWRQVSVGDRGISCREQSEGRWGPAAGRTWGLRRGGGQR